MLGLIVLVHGVLDVSSLDLELANLLWQVVDVVDELTITPLCGDGKKYHALALGCKPSKLVSHIPHVDHDGFGSYCQLA